MDNAHTSQVYNKCMARAQESSETSLSNIILNLCHKMCCYVTAHRAQIKALHVSVPSSVSMTI
jgi:hypothetical protein